MGGIDSYGIAIKFDLTSYNPSLWTFNMTTNGINSSCSEWMSLNGTCIYGRCNLGLCIRENQFFVIPLLIHTLRTLR